MEFIKLPFYISIIGLIPIILTYSYMQDKNLPKIYGIKISSGVKHIFKAMSGLYFANGIVYILAVLGYIPIKTGLIVLITFMFGLAFGRLVSFLVDKEKRKLFIFYFLLEGVVGILGVFTLLTIK